MSTSSLLSRDKSQSSLADGAPRGGIDDKSFHTFTSNFKTFPSFCTSCWPPFFNPALQLLPPGALKGGAWRAGLAHQGLREQVSSVPCCPFRLVLWTRAEHGRPCGCGGGGDFKENREDAVTFLGGRKRCLGLLRAEVGANAGSLQQRCEGGTGVGMPYKYAACLAPRRFEGLSKVLLRKTQWNHGVFRARCSGDQLRGAGMEAREIWLMARQNDSATLNIHPPFNEENLPPYPHLCNSNL
nr:uncharacterized protein LOC123290026 [Equus asinus]